MKDQGRLRIHRAGFGVVELDGQRGSLRIPRTGIGNALDGDWVAVEPLPRRAAGRARRGAGAAPVGAARIVAIVERRRPVVVGLLRHGSGYDYLIPDQIGAPRNVRVTGYAKDVKRPPDKYVAAVRLAPWDAARDALAGEVVTVLGAPGTPGLAARGIALAHGFDAEHQPATQAEARAMQVETRPAALEERRDLRPLASFTIDPEEARDFDDALSVEPLPGGGLRLGIHIAAVAHYVQPDSAVDREAAARGVSVYLSDRFIPMLPMDLTTEVCSLHPDADRLTHSVLVEIGPDGQIGDYVTTPSRIRSQARLAYEQVEAFFQRGAALDVPSGVREGLTALRPVVAAWRAARLRAGALALNLPEIRVVFDARGRPIALKRRTAGEANQLVEECMLLANRLVARKFIAAHRAALFRVHEPPAPADWEELTANLAELGYRLRRPDRAGLNAVLKEAAQRPAGDAAQWAILRSLKQARYSVDPAEHFGLGWDDYLHFTSPIRRYPDLLTHRALIALEKRRPAPHSKPQLERVAAHCSQREREAMEAERESLDTQRILYYQRLLARGEIGPYAARIVRHIGRGAIVELEETLQRGLVRAQEFERPAGTVRGARRTGSAGRTRRRPGLPPPGAALEVRLLAVDAQRRWVDFRL